MKKWVSISVTNYLGGRGKPPPTPLKGRFFAEVRSSHLLLPVVVVTKSVLQAYVEQPCKLGVPDEKLCFNFSYCIRGRGKPPPYPLKDLSFAEVRSRLVWL